MLVFFIYINIIFHALIFLASVADLGVILMALWLGGCL
jgi:hypothetical protein